MMIDTVPKFYSAIPMLMTSSSYFPNHTIDLIYTWNDYRYRSKVLFIITFTHAYELKVKVTGLEILYFIPDNVKFMTTNDQTIAQEILSRAKMA